MRISLEQKCGTLYGLRQGLLLETIPSDKQLSQSKLMIFPHGTITTRLDGQTNNVEINVESTIRTPPFFTFQVDEICQQLKASNSSYSAWFYLAYLHALTSHGLPEPFTEMSGTERALQILQSGYVWSSAPYDDEALVTLKLIAKLAPCRKNKNGMQFAKWPDNIPRHAVQDSFLIITQQLVSDSKRLYELHSKSEKEDDKKQKKESKGDDIDVKYLVVNKREYYRCLPYFPNLQISETFIEQKISIATHYIHNEIDTTLRPVRIVSSLYHQNTFHPPKNFSITKYLTSNRKTLRGLEDCENEEEIFDTFSMQGIANVWISLYNLAHTGNFSREKFALILGLLTFENNEDVIDPILVLQTVAANIDIFASIEPPQTQAYNLKDNFDRTTLQEILESHHTKPTYPGRYDEIKISGTRFNYKNIFIKW